MQTYNAPLRDMRFVMHELHARANLAELPGLQESTPDLLDSVLEEAPKFMASVLLPLIPQYLEFTGSVLYGRGVGRYAPRYQPRQVGNQVMN